jgi:hypothetical protein
MSANHDGIIALGMLYLGVIDCHCWPTKVISLTFGTCVVWCPLSCAFSLGCWDIYWGFKKWLVEGTCGSLPSSYSIGI